MTRPIYLIRHARTRINPTTDAADWVLEPSALQDCYLLATSLKDAGITRLVTSKEPKAITTGQTVAEALALPLEVAVGLHEHDRRGVPFLSAEVFQQTLRQFFAEPDKLVFGTETANEALARFSMALQRVQATYSKDSLAVVSHGTVMSLFIAKHNPVNVLAFWQALKMPDVLKLSADYRLEPAE